MDARDFFEMMALMRGIMFDSAELDKLEDMLIEAKIPYRRETTQIAYYGKELPVRNPNSGLGVGAICSVISHGYGSEEGLLEIQGLMTDEEIEKSGSYVLGYLTAENVFERIKNHYEGKDND